MLSEEKFLQHVETAEDMSPGGWSDVNPSLNPCTKCPYLDVILVLLARHQFLWSASKPPLDLQVNRGHPTLKGTCHLDVLPFPGCDVGGEICKFSCKRDGASQPEIKARQTISDYTELFYFYIIFY